MVLLFPYSLICHSRKSTGVINNINKNGIPLRLAGSSALLLIVLFHYHGLLGHLMELSHQ